jgi:hypothetical protein
MMRLQRGDKLKGAKMAERAADVPSAEVLAHVSSRKDFLRMAGAAGLGAALGSNVLLSRALANHVAVVDDPTDLHFQKTSQYRPFDVISKNFVEHSDGFDKNLGLYEVFTPAPERRRGGVSLNNGRLRVSGDSPFFTLFRTNQSPSAPYAAVIVDVRTFSHSATNQNSVYAGLIQDASNYVVAWYNDATKKAGIDVAVKGNITKLVERDVLTAPVRFAFVLNSKEVTALADIGDGPFDGWRPVANYPNPPEVSGDPAITLGLSQYVDLRDPAVLAQYSYGFGVRGGSGSIVLDKVEAGYWGRAGVRDPHVCTWADGTPYIKDNKLYLTLTNAGCDFFSTAHWGVYTIDLSDYASPDALEEVAKIFFEREENDPDKEVKVFGDHAGHIVYDNATGKFLVGASTWGDFTYRGVQINYTRTSENVLGGVHVLTEAQKLDLPPTPGITYTNRGNWDPHFVRIAGEWYVAFVDSPSQGSPWWHYPALAKGPTLERVDLELVGAESDLNQTEGVVMQKFGGVWYLLCSSGRDELGDEDAGPKTYRIYLPERDEDPNNKPAGYGLKFFGKLDAPYVSNIPHPMVTPIPDGGNTKWIMLTFDGTDFYGWDQEGYPILDYGTHGDFYVMDGNL